MITRIKRDDWGYDLTYTYTDEDGTAINISDASSVSLKIGRLGGTTSITKTMSWVTDGSDGKVKVSFAETDLATAGYYDAEIQVNYTNGRRTSKMFTVHVLPNL